MNASRLGAVYGPWRVEAFLAAGGMADVWIVRHTGNDGRAVLKVARTRDPELLARAAREGEIQAALSHPNIVRALDRVDVEGVPGIVLEWVEGGRTLEVCLRESLDGAAREQLANGILAGLEAAHAAGFIHRDLKPANLMVSGSGEGMQVQLLDFGLARREFDAGPEKMTRAGYILGSAGYLAPEQARDAGSVDARADVWSLGCVLYELASGTPAFTGRTLDEVLGRVSEGRVVPLDAVAPHAPPRWVVAVGACLRVNPAERPPNVAVVREILQGKRSWVAEASTRSRPGAPAGRREPPKIAVKPPVAAEKGMWVVWAAVGALMGAATATVWWWSGS